MASQTRRRERSRLVMRAAVLATVTTTPVLGSALRAQTDGTCIPVAQRAGRTFGCFSVRETTYFFGAFIMSPNRSPGASGSNASACVT